MTAGVGKRLSPAERLEVIRLYQTGVGSGDLGRQFGVTDVAVRAHLRKAGVVRRDASACHRIYTINEKAFDELTPDSAYWLGMLITDGSVSLDGTPRLELKLAAIDRQHVESFGVFMGSNAPVRICICKKDRTRSAVWSVRSRPLAKRLDEWGITRRKTFTARAHPRLCGSRDFWRGVLDGDGSIKEHNNFPGIRILGTAGICEQFAEFCTTWVERKRIHIAPMSSVFYAEMGGNDALRVLVGLYDQCGYALARKREAAARLALQHAGRIFRILPPRRRSND